MNNLWSQKCSELRSHSQYNVKLSISTSLSNARACYDVRSRSVFEVYLIDDTASFQGTKLFTSFKWSLQTSNSKKHFSYHIY